MIAFLIRESHNFCYYVKLLTKTILCFSSNVAKFLRTPFSQNTSGRLLLSKSSRPEVFCKKGFLRNFTKFTGKHPWKSLFFLPEACNFIKKKTLAQVFSCEFCEISKNTFFHSFGFHSTSKWQEYND